MTKLNTKIVPLTYERYQALIDTSPKTDQEVQCDIVNNKSDILRETPCKRRGQRVLWHMEDNDMHWDDEERLVMGEQTVANTNIVNIIKVFAPMTTPQLDQDTPKTSSRYLY